MTLLMSFKDRVDISPVHFPAYMLWSLESTFFCTFDRLCAFAIAAFFKFHEIHLLQMDPTFPVREGTNYVDRRGCQLPRWLCFQKFMCINTRESGILGRGHVIMALLDLPLPCYFKIWFFCELSATWSQGAWSNNIDVLVNCLGGCS